MGIQIKAAAIVVGYSSAQFEQTVVSTGHSRIPVFGEDLDDVRGFVHAKDLIAVGAPDLHAPIDPGLIRSVPVIPDSTPVSPVLEMMRSQAVHLAVAINEHGSVAWLVTLEDIAEELVGDIRDEHDIREVMAIRPAGRDRYLVAGQTRADRLVEVGAPVEAGEATHHRPAPALPDFEEAAFIDDQLDHPAAVRWVQPVGRLIEQQDVPAGAQQLGQMHAIAFTPGQVANPFLLIGSPEIESTHVRP